MVASRNFPEYKIISVLDQLVPFIFQINQRSKRLQEEREKLCSKFAMVFGVRGIIHIILGLYIHFQLLSGIVFTLERGALQLRDVALGLGGASQGEWERLKGERRKGGQQKLLALTGSLTET